MGKKPAFRASFRRPSMTRQSSKERISITKDVVPESDGRPPKGPELSLPSELNFLTDLQLQETKWETLDDTINLHLDLENMYGGRSAGQTNRDPLNNISHAYASHLEPNAISKLKHIVSNGNS